MSDGRDLIAAGDGGQGFFGGGSRGLAVPQRFEFVHQIARGLVGDGVNGAIQHQQIVDRQMQPVAAPLEELTQRQNRL